MPEPLRSECITLENRRRAKFDERSHWLRLGMDWASRRGCRGKVAEQESVETWDHAEIGSPVGTAAQTQLQVALKDLCDLGERMMDFFGPDEVPLEPAGFPLAPAVVDV
jgi:hypothetical protein